MNVIQQLSSPTMYLICGGIIVFIATVCVIFAVRAWRAGKAIGMDTAVLKRVVTSSASFSVLPAVGILLGVIALSGALGIPWPWLRLSVIGALHYETQVAQGAAEQVGIQLSGSEMTASAFATIALLMSVCIMWGIRQRPVHLCRLCAAAADSALRSRRNGHSDTSGREIESQVAGGLLPGIVHVGRNGVRSTAEHGCKVRRNET